MRYAIYLTPPDGSPLAEAAATWLGRSPFRPSIGAPAAPPAAAAEVPARYGFHATLRAPFRLAAGVAEDELIAAFRHFATTRPPLDPPLTIAPLSRFLAFRSDDPALSKTAAAAVEAFEPMRAPLTELDRARRNPEALDARGLELLEQWGYPHVMERFVFHMTLTGPLAGDEDAVLAAARSHFGPLDGAPHRLIHAVYREDEPGGPFTIIATQDAVANDNADPSL